MLIPVTRAALRVAPFCWPSSRPRSLLCRVSTTQFVDVLLWSPQLLAIHQRFTKHCGVGADHIYRCALLRCFQVLENVKEVRRRPLVPSRVRERNH